MQFQFIPYLVPLFMSFIILIALAVYGYKHRAVRGAKAFTICMIIGSLWALGNGLEMAGMNLSTKLFWANIQYIAYAFAPVVWLIMVLQFTDREGWINKKNILIMSIIPVITIILVWTDPLYGLVRSNFVLDTSGSFSVISKDYGAWFWVHFAYCYILNFATVVFLFRTFLLKNTVYRKQSLYLLIGFLIIGISNVMYVIGLSPIAGIDLSPIFFSISGVIVGWGIFHFHLFDLVPIARETVIEKMGSGIMVIDQMKRIIDINPQAKSMLKLSGKIMGQNVNDISPEFKDLIPAEEEINIVQTEFKSEDGDEQKDEGKKSKYYEVYLSPITDYRKKHIAWVLILNDITDLKLAREQINQQQQELAVMNERERMSRDLHDNLGQVLSFASVQIQAVRQEIKKDNKELADQYLQKLNTIIKDAHKDIREYVYNIRDDSYSKRDIIPLLKEEVEKLTEHSSLEVEFEVGEDNLFKTLGIEEKMQLVHIAREAFTNILKYAKADIVSISLTAGEKKGSKEKRGEMIIADDGKGIDGSVPEGSGLNIMSERAKLISGQLKIESGKAEGTKVICNFPL